jgi:hypothetical protein
MAAKKKEEHDTQMERMEAQQEELAALKLQVLFTPPRVVESNELTSAFPRR